MNWRWRWVSIERRRKRWLNARRRVSWVTATLDRGDRADQETQGRAEAAYYAQRALADHASLETLESLYNSGRFRIQLPKFPGQPGHQCGRRLSFAKQAVARCSIANSIAWMWLSRRTPQLS